MGFGFDIHRLVEGRELWLAGVKLPAGLPDLSTFLAYGAQHADESSLTAFLGVG